MTHQPSPLLVSFIGKVILFCFLCTVVILSVIITYAVFVPTPTSELKREILTPIVTRGKFLIVRYSFTRPSSCSVYIYRTIVDASNTIIYEQSEYRPALPAARSPTGSFPAIRQIVISSVAAMGLASYDVTLEWACNPIQRVWPSIVELPPLKFMVLGEQYEK